MKLRWPGFSLECSEGGLHIRWAGSGDADIKAERCTSVTLGPPGPDGSCQWVFQFRSAKTAPPGLVAVRVDVPAQQVPGAEKFTAMLLHEYEVPDRCDDPAEGAELQRVPVDAPEWIVAPAGTASEELSADVMAHVAGDAG